MPKTAAYCVMVGADAESSVEVLVEHSETPGEKAWTPHAWASILTPVARAGITPRRDLSQARRPARAGSAPPGWRTRRTRGRPRARGPRARSGRPRTSARSPFALPGRRRRTRRGGPGCAPGTSRPSSRRSRGAPSGGRGAPTSVIPDRSRSASASAAIERILARERPTPSRSPPATSSWRGNAHTSTPPSSWRRPKRCTNRFRIAHAASSEICCAVTAMTSDSNGSADEGRPEAGRSGEDLRVRRRERRRGRSSPRACAGPRRGRPRSARPRPCTPSAEMRTTSPERSTR